MVILALGLLVWALIATARAARPVAHSHAVVSVRVDGKPVRWWAARARQNGRDLRWQQTHARRLEHRLRVRLVPVENAYEHAAELAATVYGVDAGMLIRKGRCESSGWTRFLNTVTGAAGPWQFLRSTWASTPFAAFSPYDPVAAALAAGWMHHVGRGGEWDCT